MSSDTVQFQVTGDPDKLALLKQKHNEGVGSQALGEFAMSIGLTPPGQDERDWVPSVVFEFPPGDDQGVMVWDLVEDEEHGEEDDWDEDENPWEGVVQVHKIDGEQHDSFGNGEEVK